jgi:hypothetical protein
VLLRAVEMLRHAARAVPWTLLIVVAGVLAALVRTVAEWPWQVWPLQGIAVGLLAAAVTYAFDEPAAELVDTLPRALWWRTTARSSAGVLLVLWWGLLVSAAGDAWFGHPWAVAGQGAAAVLAAVAGVTVLRRRGRATPAAASSSAIITVSVFVSLARPWEDHLPLFPYTPMGPWQASVWWWTAIAVASGAWLVASLLETSHPRRPHRRRGPAGADGSGAVSTRASPSAR